MERRIYTICNIYLSRFKNCKCVDRGKRKNKQISKRKTAADYRGYHGNKAYTRHDQTVDKAVPFCGLRLSEAVPCQKSEADKGYCRTHNISYKSEKRTPFNDTENPEIKDKAFPEQNRYSHNKGSGRHDPAKHGTDVDNSLHYLAPFSLLNKTPRLLPRRIGQEN